LLVLSVTEKLALQKKKNTSPRRAKPENNKEQKEYGIEDHLEERAHAA